MKFPVVVNYFGCDELQFLQDVQALSDAMHGLIAGQDKVIDSEGSLYLFDKDNGFELASQIKLSKFESLIQKHALANQACCIAKLKLSRFSDGFDYIQRLETE